MLKEGRLEKRARIIGYIYSQILLYEKIDIKDAFESGDYSEKEIKIIESIIKNQYKFKKLIISLLKKTWSWERIGVHERAILIYGSYELLFNDKALVINELITIARGYIPGDSYKFINGILNNIGDFYDKNKSNKK